MFRQLAMTVSRTSSSSPVNPILVMARANPAACRMVAFLVLLYVIYAGSLLIDGVGLGAGLFPGGGSFAITVVPAIFGAVLFVVVGAMALLPGDIERRLGRWASGSERESRWVARAGAIINGCDIETSEDMTTGEQQATVVALLEF